MTVNPSDPILATTSTIVQLSPGKNKVISRIIKGDESADISRCLDGRSRDHIRGSETHIRLNTDVTMIVTWHPVSIINSTSVPSAQPVRNHGAPEPIAQTKISSLSFLDNRLSYRLISIPICLSVFTHYSPDDCTRYRAPHLSLLGVLLQSVPQLDILWKERHIRHSHHIILDQTATL